MSDRLDTAFVEIEPDFDSFGRRLRRGLDDATRVIRTRLSRAFNDAEDTADTSGQRIGETLSDSITEALGEGLSRDANGRLRDELGRFVADGEREGGRAGRGFGDGFASGLASTLSSIVGIRLPVGGFLVFGAAVGALATAAIQLTAALAPAVGVIAGLPSVIGVASAAIGTLQLATAGVGDAFAAAFGDAEEFEEALENLAPAAREVAQVVRDLAPAFTEFQQSVQQQFFAGMAEEIELAAGALLGPLTEGATAAASGMGDIVERLLEVAASSAGVDFVTSSFETLNNVIANIAAPVADLFEALLNLGSAINEAFGGEEAGAGLASMIQQFADFIQAAVDSGEAVAWVENASAVFSALGDILSPIVGIMGSIGDAADATGGNILGVFGEALSVFDDFLSSAEGMATLTALFDTFNTIGGAFADILAGIGPALPSIIDGINDLVSAVVPLIAPLAEVVGELLIALAPILGIVARAIQPLIPPLVELIQLFGDFLVDAIDQLMPTISQLAELFAGPLGRQAAVAVDIFAAFLPVIGSLLSAVLPLVEALFPLIEIFIEIQTRIAEFLVPILEALAEILLWVVETIIIPIVIPILVELARQFSEGLTLAIEGFAIFFTSMIEGIVAIFEWLQERWNFGIAVLRLAWTLLQNGLEAGWNFIRNNVFEPIGNGIAAVGNTISVILGGIRGTFNRLVNFLGNLPGRVGSAVSGMWDGIASSFRAAINAVIDGWNNLSFTVPSVDLGPLGSVGGFTVNTPNIPRLQTGGFTTDTGLALLHPDEVVLPLSNQNGINALADAMRQAGAGAGDSGPVTVIVKIGDRELTDIVDTQVSRNNRTATRRARAGVGRV